jgi:hypothetical protein
MTLPSARGIMTILVIAGLSLISQAQPSRSGEGEAKPYKILTSGKHFTVKSTKEIKNVMVWTSSGHRIIEQKDINSTSFSFDINVEEKFFFVMIQIEGMKPFTEKIGVGREIS